MKEVIRKFAKGLGVDDVGFAAASDYKSPLSPALESILPAVRSMVVLAYEDLDNCESDNPQIMFSGRMEAMEFSRSCNYKLVRFLKKEFKAKAMSVPPSYPLHMSYETKGAVGDVSLRHAAVAAGLGNFGRHNLVIHPQMGSRVLFTAVLTDLPLTSQAPVTEKLCTDCRACVDNCPGKALDQEGKTHLMRCLKNSQPYGIARSIDFWTRFAEAGTEEKKSLIRDVEYWRLYQAGFLGFQYFCINCVRHCPLGEK